MGKLLFFDIDGTLAIPGQRPSRATVEAIQTARKNGHKAFLSTGRTVRSVPDFIDEIGFDGGIYSAGGVVVADGETIRNRTMPPELLQTVRAAMEHHGLFYTLECASGNYSRDRFPTPQSAARGSTELQRMFALPYRKRIEQYTGDPVYKVAFMAESQRQIDSLAQSLPDTAKLVAFGNMVPDFPLIGGEVSDKNIHKGLALREICEFFRAPVAESIAFGDSMNDAEILLAAGIGIAMGNAEDRVKRLADSVCPACSDDGVAKALRSLGLLCAGLRPDPPGALPLDPTAF